MSPQRSAFEEPASPIRQRLIAPVTVMIASLITIWPVIATVSILPPFGLLLLLAWRLRRQDSVPVWAPLGLGLFDDLLSGQPIGSAMVLWTLCFLAIDVIDRRLMFRDFWQDWLVAAGGITACLVLGRLIASPIGAHVDTFLIVQIIVTILFYPAAASVVGWLDAKRG